MIKHLNNIVKSEIKTLLLEILSNPLSYFSEKALQVKFVAKLIQYPEFAHPSKTNIVSRYFNYIKKLEVEDKYLEGILSIPILQMEYGNNSPGPYRIDIAILDPKDIVRIDNFQFQSSGKYLNPIIGIEIGTEKTNIKKLPKEHLENDIFKLKTSKIGYIFYIIRNNNKCRVGTKSFIDKCQQIEDFKKDFKNASLKHPAINYICLINHILYQKVEFFDSLNNWIELKNPSKELNDAIKKKLENTFYN